ncbi:MAG: T9SS type A sorting domain-containing protein [Flavobacteriales bacterium]|nr:T9SS type A sorting domain-containing protein [Flavobacteriales bacterium]
MKIFNRINPNVKWIAGVFTVIGLMVFTTGYTISNAFSDDDKIIVKIMKINNGDTTVIEREFTNMEELEALEHEMSGEDLHNLGMKMWFFSDKQDKDDSDQKAKDFKFIIEHGEASGDHKIHKKIIICSNGDTVETADFNFDMEKMHRVMAKAFHHIDEMDFNFNFDFNDSMHFEYHDFNDEEFQRKLEKMEKHIEKAIGNFQFNFEIDEDSIRKDCRIIVKSFPQDMDHMEKMMEDIIIEIKIEGDEEDGEKKVVKHVVKVYTADDNEDEQFKVAPKNQLEITDLTVYPNPGNGEFKIIFELASKGQTEVEIRDIKGGVVFHDEFKNPKNGSYSRKVNLEGSAKGIYILTVKQGKKLANKKLIIR